MNYSYCTWTCVAPIWIISNNLNNICVTDLPGLNTHTHAHRRAYTHTHTAREAGEWYTCTVHGAYQRMLFVYYDHVNVHTPLRSVHPLLYFPIIFKQSIVWNLLTCDYLIDYYPGPIFLSWFYCVYAPQCILAHKSPSAFCSNDKFFFLFFSSLLSIRITVSELQSNAGCATYGASPWRGLLCNEYPSDSKGKTDNQPKSPFRLPIEDENVKKK